jgi:competence protein ComEC
MRRPLLWVTLCYLSGLAAGELALYLPLTTVLLPAAMVAAAAPFVRRRGALPPRSALLIGAIALLIGFVSAHRTLAGLERPALDSWRDRGPVELTGQVDGLPEAEQDRTVVLLDLESAASMNDPSGAAARSPAVAPPSAIPLTGRIRVNVRGMVEGGPAIHAGDRLRFTAELRRPYGLHNVGLFDAGRYAQRQGIDAAALVRADQVIRLDDGNGWLDRYFFRPVEAWRARVDRAMTASLSPPSAALLSSLILGETSRLTPDMRDAFTAAGVAHLLSISGSHLALLAGVIFLLVRGACHLLPARWLLWLTMRLSPTQLAILATVPAVVWYTALAGGQVATIRSLLMLLLYCGAVLLSRPHDLLTALAVAALVVLAVDPLALGAISFQLSYGAVLGMGLALVWWSGWTAEERQREPAVSGPDEEAPPWWRPWLRRSALYLLLTVAATAATAPLVLYHFRQFNWVGLVSNMVLPVIGVVVIPLGLLSAWLTLLFSSSTLPFAALNEWAVTALTAVVGWFARWPGAVVHLAAPSLLTVALLYTGMAALVWGRRMRWLGALGVTAGAVWMMIALAGLLRPDGQLRVNFLDVGQGDAAVITAPTGQTMVIDGGPQYGGYDTGRAVVAPYLWDHGIHRIDYLVASHPQADHIGGQVALLHLFPVGELWQNGVRRGGSVADGWRAAAEADSARLITIRSVHEPVRIGPVQIDLLHPSGAFVPDNDNPDGHGLNDSAIVLRIGLGEHRFLFTGDIEKPAETELLRVAADRLEATVLKVPHHGSRTSSTPEFLNAVHPRDAVISVGAYNPYHHPAPPVVEAYEARGVDLLRTDQEGQVTYLTDGTTLRRFTAQELTWRPVLHLRTASDEEWENYRRLWLRWWWRV